MTDITETVKRAEVGDIVLYTLSKNDCDTIIQNRQSAGQGTKRGNVPRPGDVLPAMIVKVWRTKQGDAAGVDPHVNLQVFLDGDDTLWAPSRSRFDPKVHGSFLAPLESSLRDEWKAKPEGHWVTR